MTKPELMVNSAQCLLCKQVLISAHRHDYRTCKCGSTSVDGGLVYCRRLASTMADIKELSIYLVDDGFFYAEDIDWSEYEDE